MSVTPSGTNLSLKVYLRVSVSLLHSQYRRSLEYIVLFLRKFTRHNLFIGPSNWSQLLRIRQWGFLIRMNLQLRMTLDTFVLCSFTSLNSRISLQHQLYDKRRSKILSQRCCEIKLFSFEYQQIIQSGPVSHQTYEDDSLRDSHCGRPIL